MAIKLSGCDREGTYEVVLKNWWRMLRWRIEVGCRLK